MSRELKQSRRRIQENLHKVSEIQVKKLKKKADLEQILSETVCREIYGSHVYIQVPNFAYLVSQQRGKEAEYKQLIQGIHLYQREVVRIVTSLGGTFIHFQGSKLHALFYHPINNTQRLASLAVLLQLIIKDIVQNVFNRAFPYHFTT